MQEQHGGGLSTSPPTALRAGAAGEAVYAATKAGLLGFAIDRARGRARRRDRQRRLPGPGRHGHYLPRDPRRLAAAARRAAAGDPGRSPRHAEEVAAATAIPAAPAAGFVTGQVLSVNGGIAMA